MLISVRDLTIGYGDTPLMEGLNFDICRHEVFVILGGSGCGKSTLLRHLIGLNEPMSGEIRWAMRDEGDGHAPPFGVMFQAGALFSSMTLLENVALPLQKWTDLSGSTIESVAAARLRLVGLGGFENHLPSDISGGMRKRAAIARALALDPPVLFMDEPSAGLDPISAVELDDLILTMREHIGVTTVLVTHELESIFRICTRCIMLDRATRGIIAEGDPRELRDHSEDERVTHFFRRQPSGA